MQQDAQSNEQFDVEFDVFLSHSAHDKAVVHAFILYNFPYIDEEAIMLTFKVTTVGASEGFILNKEAKAKLNVQKGDILYLTDAPDGALRITPYNPDFERQMKLAEQIMHDDREILRVLAK